MVETRRSRARSLGGSQETDAQPSTQSRRRAKSSTPRKGKKSTESETLSKANETTIDNGQECVNATATKRTPRTRKETGKSKESDDISASMLSPNSEMHLSKMEEDDAEITAVKVEKEEENLTTLFEDDGPVEDDKEDEKDAAQTLNDGTVTIENDGQNADKQTGASSDTEAESGSDDDIEGQNEGSVLGSENNAESSVKAYPKNDEEGDIAEDSDDSDKNGDNVDQTRMQALREKEERKEIASTEDHSQMQNKRRRKKKKQPTNELTHLLPGYTAPMRLTTSFSATMTAPSSMNSSALENMRRKAMKDDQASKKLRENARLMTQRSTTGNLTSLYQNSHASYYKKRKQQNSAETAGSGWFNMKPTAVTEELERDMALIRNRNYLDPKRFYKSADNPRPGMKTVVQAGTVIEGPTEFYSSRLTKKQRRSNLVDEVMADPESAQWAQQKYKRMQQEKNEQSRKWGKNVKNRQDFRKKKAN